MDKREILERLDTIYHDMARAHDKSSYFELQNDVSELLESLMWLMDDIRSGRSIR